MDSTRQVSVSGTVRDDYTANPIPGATVTAGSKSTTTGSDGRFSLDGISTPLIGGQPVAPLVNIQASGFVTWSQPVAVPGGAGAMNADLFRTNALFDVGEMLVYLPPPNTPIRGVFLNMFNSTDGDSRPLMRADSSYYNANAGLSNIMSFRRKMMAFARTNGLAIMGAKIAFADTATDAWPKFLDALRSASTLSGRAELADAPLIIHGYGAGGCIAYGIPTLYPQRVIGFIAEKMAGPCMGDGAAAIGVPGYLIHGKQSSVVGLEAHFTSTFERNRARGAIWALGFEQDAAGQMLRNHDILFNWLSDVVAARLPAVSQGVPSPLNPLSESSGWLGDMSAFAIGSWLCYNANKATASWLSSQRSAQDWQGLMSPGVTRPTINCW